MIVDVIVAGSGSAGMTTAIVAAQAGLDVLLVEKSAVFGGATALSGGGVWVPNNSLMKKAGWDDNRTEALAYIKGVVGNHFRGGMIEAFLDNGPAAIDYMQAHTSVQLLARPGPDYFPDAPGGKLSGRSLAPAPFDGRLLGNYLAALRPPLTQFNAPWGMMLSALDAAHALNIFRSFTAAKHMGKLFLEYGRDRLVQGRGTRLVMGNALAARFLKSALDAGVKLWTESPVISLTMGDGRVVGATIRHDGKDTVVTARRGVVVATGGFAGNTELRQRYLPLPAMTKSLVPNSNAGDGIAIAEQLGGHCPNDNVVNGNWAVVSHYRQRNGAILPVPHFFHDLPKPGSIVVNQKGDRFGNESSLRLAEAMYETGSVPAWIVCDADFIQKYGLGYVLPFGIRRRKLLKQGYLKRASSVAGLAKTIGVDLSSFEKTIAAANEAARAGSGDPFGKGGTAFDRSLGDLAHAPNPCLGPIARAPFYAIQVFPGDVSTNVGLSVSTKGEVLDKQGAPIPGLYANGLDMNSIWAGILPANGGYHGVNMTFGYIIAQQLIAQR